MSNGRRAGRANLLLFVPSLLLLGAFYFLPLADVVRVSLSEPPGGGNYAELATNPALQRIFGTTFRVSAETTLVSLLLGYAVAYALTHGSRRQVRVMLVLVIIPFWVSALVRAFAWVVLLRSRGIVNGTLMGAGIIERPLSLLYNEFGVLVGMVHYMVPLAVLTLYAQMRSIDARLVQAARGLGAGRAVAFLRVFLPLSVPGIIAAGVLIFISALGFFITPAILGGGKSLMIAEYVSFLIFETLNWGLGTALATSLMAAILILLALSSRLFDFRRAFGAA